MEIVLIIAIVAAASALIFVRRDAHGTWTFRFPGGSATAERPGQKQSISAEDHALVERVSNTAPGAQQDVTAKASTVRDISQSTED